MTSGLGCLLALAAVLVGAAGALGAAAVGDGEWPMLRHDAQNTAASPLIGAMGAAPARRAAYRLGGRPSDAYLLGDLDGDGLEEIVTASGGPVRALRGSGKRLWSTLLPQGQPHLLGMGDLDGDGSLEVVCSTDQPATIHVLGGRDGRVLWQRSFEEQVSFANGTRLADLDADGLPELFLLGNAPAQNSGRLGWAFSFRGDSSQPRMLWGPLPLPFNPHFRPQTIVADVDGDGRAEVVVASAVHSSGLGLMVAAFDGATGELKRKLAYPNGDRNYGHLQAIRTGSKPQRDLLVVGMLGRPHVTFITNDAQGMREVWHCNDTIRVPYNPVADVDGDGRLEVVYTRIDDTGRQPGPRDAILTIRDLLTGAVKQELPGMMLQGIADLDGDGRMDMVAATVPGDALVLYAGDARQKPLPIPEASACLVAPRPPLHMMNEALESRSGYNVFTHDVDGDGVPELLVSTPEALLAVDARSLKVKLWYPFGAGGPLRLLGAGRLLGRKGETLLLAGDAGLVVVGRDGKQRSRIPVHQCSAVPAVAARLRHGGPVTVLATRPDGAVVALDGPRLARGRVRVLWEHPRLGGFTTPTVADLEGDGQPSVLVCDRATAEPVALDGAGRIRRRLPPLPTDGTRLVTGTCVAGRFGDGSRVLMGAVSGVGPNDSLARWTTLDPGDGRAVWQRDRGVHPWRTPCVWDLNGDGVDDLVWVHYFDLIAVDGRTGADLWAIPDRIPGYHIASVADVDGSGKPSIVLSGGYMGIYRFSLEGREVWRTPPLNYNAGSAGALADVDGDGKLELGTAFTDRFGCYNAADGKVKWSIPLPGRGSDVAAADLDGDGRPEFLFGCADGHLYAVKAPSEGTVGRVLWRLYLGAPVGPPSIADLDGDGRGEILVATHDGWLHVLAAGKHARGEP